MIPVELEKHVFNGRAIAKRTTLGYGAEMRIANPSNFLTVVTEVDIQPFINTNSDFFGTIFTSINLPVTTVTTIFSEALSRGIFTLEIRDDKNIDTITIQNPFTFKVVADAILGGGEYPNYSIIITPNPTPQKFDIYFVSSKEIYITFKFAPATYVDVAGVRYYVSNTIIDNHDVADILNSDVTNAINPNGIRPGNNSLPTVTKAVTLVQTFGINWIYAPLLYKNISNVTPSGFKGAAENINYPMDASTGTGYLFSLPGSSVLFGRHLEQYYPKINVMYVLFNQTIQSDIAGKL